MEIRTQYPIDPLTTSFRQLKEMVGSTRGQKFPNAQALLDSGEEVLFSCEYGDTTVTVFLNGFFVYREGKRQAVYAVDRCGRLYYRYGNDEIRAVDKTNYADGPCLIPLLMMGDERLEHDPACYEMFWCEFSRGNESQEEWTPNAENDGIREEEISQVRGKIDCLTKRQRQIVCLRYHEGMSKERIAAILGGISPERFAGAAGCSAQAV